jgi:hypothetical protein
MAEKKSPWPPNGIPGATLQPFKQSCAKERSCESHKISMKRSQNIKSEVNPLPYGQMQFAYIPIEPQ